MNQSISELDQEEGRPLFTSRRRRGRSVDPSFWAVAAVLAVLAVLLVVVALGALRRDAELPPVQVRDQPAEAALRSAEAGAASPAPAPLAVDLPELNASDALVRRLAQTLSSHPALAEWLATEELVRLFVVSVTNLAQGSSPASRLDFMAPEGDFAVQVEGGVMRVDPASYHRYDGLVEAFVSLDDQGVATLYQRLLPLFEEAYRELGLGDGSFSRTLARAVGIFLTVPVPREPPVLVEDGAVYAFADPVLEELTPAEKHLVRMGPENAARVQAKLRTLARAMALPISR
jgi:hypothetical protein